MSADGYIVRSIGEVRDLELREMSRLVELLSAQVSEANARAADAVQYSEKLCAVAQALLHGFQRQDAATVELVNHLVLDPDLDEKTKRLLANLNEARRAGLRRTQTSQQLPLHLAAE